MTRRAKLEVSVAQKDGRTYVDDVCFTAPLKLTKPFYQPDGTMKLMLLSVSAGLMDGDEQEMRIRVGADARVELTNQSYEKIHRMRGGEARRTTEISVAAGAVLDYHPLPILPFAQSAFTGRTAVALEGDAKLMLSEILSCGRVAHGERFAYRYYRSRLVVTRDGIPVFCDNNHLEGEGLDGLCMYEGYTHTAAFLFSGWGTDALEQLAACVERAPDCTGGVSITAFGDVAARVLGRSAQALEQLYACMATCCKMTTWDK